MSSKPGPDARVKTAWAEQSVRHVLLVGAGNIAQTHAAALQALPGFKLAGVADRDEKQARRLAERYALPYHFASAEAALTQGGFDAAHILTPPPFHKEVAYPLLKAGIPCFIEKPMAHNSEACGLLRDVARQSGAALRVNQNFIFHPAHQKLRAATKSRKIGPLREIRCHFAMPLRQLAARQLGHWMFDAPVNLLLEQAIHPLSQLDDLCGPLEVIAATALPRQIALGQIRKNHMIKDPKTLGLSAFDSSDSNPGSNDLIFNGPMDGNQPISDKVAQLATRWQITMKGADNTLVTLTILLGAKFPLWEISALGDDGVMRADYLTNLVTCDRAGAYLDTIDHFRRGIATGFSHIRQTSNELLSDAAARLGMRGRRDAFYLSIKGAIKAFYRDIDAGGTNLNAEQGERLVTLCEVIANQAGYIEQTNARPLPPRSATSPRILRPEAAIIGGTGFIGRAVIRKMVEERRPVRVLARHIANLDKIFEHDLVEVIEGSIADEEALKAALANCSVVINLAHGGGGESYEQIHKTLVGGACNVARALDPTRIEKLLYISSIAALYLGHAYNTVNSEISIDQNRRLRAAYARAKAEAELKMLQLYREEGVPVSIFRPGIVVGAGTSPFHSGVGLYNRERVCLGWNRGENPLPFVLVEDVASALMAAAFSSRSEALNGNAFNLIGDVRLTAQRYTALLAKKLGRPLIFKPQRLGTQQMIELSKFLIKRIGGRKTPPPSLHDLRSRGMPAWFDTAFEKKTLGWYPEDNIDIFIEQAINVHKG